MYIYQYKCNVPYQAYLQFLQNISRWLPLLNLLKKFPPSFFSKCNLILWISLSVLLWGGISVSFTNHLGKFDVYSYNKQKLLLNVCTCTYTHQSTSPCLQGKLVLNRSHLAQSSYGFHCSLHHLYYLQEHSSDMTYFVN